MDPALLQTIGQEFDSIDEQGIGRLGAQQVLTLFSRLGLDKSLEDAVAFIKQVDDNGDSYVSKEELLAAFQVRPARVREAQPGSSGSADCAHKAFGPTASPAPAAGRRACRRPRQAGGIPGDAGSAAARLTRCCAVRALRCRSSAAACARRA